MKRICLFFVIAFPMFLLSACNDREELEKQAFVVAIGLDKDEKENLVSVTFQIANPQVNTSLETESEKEPPSDIVSVPAPDILAAKELVQSSVSRKVSFSHLRTIIVGEELAKYDLFRHIIGSAIVDPEVRREAILIVSKEKANDFIHANQPTLETRPHKYYEFMERRWETTGFAPKSNLNRLFQRTDDELFLAIYATATRNETTYKDEDIYKAGQIPQETGDPVQIMGSAVMKGRKMIGILNGEETRMALLLRRRSPIQSFIASFPEPLNKEFRISAKLLLDGHTRLK